MFYIAARLSGRYKFFQIFAQRVYGIFRHAAAFFFHLFGVVESGFYSRYRVQELFFESVYFFGKLSRHRAVRSLELRFAFSVYHGYHRFRVAERELTVQKRSFCEFALIRGACARFDATFQYLVHKPYAAVTMQLKNILARVGFRRFEIYAETPVRHLSRSDRTVIHHIGNGVFQVFKFACPENLSRHFKRVVSAYPDYSYRSSSYGGGYRRYRLHFYLRKAFFNAYNISHARVDCK